MSDNSLIYFSRRWLMSTGQGERTVKIMKKIARMNGKSVNKVIYLLISVPKANYSHPRCLNLSTPLWGISAGSSRRKGPTCKKDFTRHSNCYFVFTLAYFKQISPAMYFWCYNCHMLQLVRHKCSTMLELLLKLVWQLGEANLGPVPRFVLEHSETAFGPISVFLWKPRWCTLIVSWCLHWSRPTRLSDFISMSGFNRRPDCTSISDCTSMLAFTRLSD